MVLVSVAEAAELLGRDRSGLHRLVKNGQAVADSQGRVLVAEGRLAPARGTVGDLGAPIEAGAGMSISDALDEQRSR